MCLKTYLFKRYPNIVPKQLNDMDQVYMSKTFQSKIAQKMNLTPWLRRKGGSSVDNPKYREDLMEAFFGTIEHNIYS